MKLLIKGVELNGVATDIYIENKYIKQIGPGLSVAADKVIDGSRKAAIPGFVNTHTHAAMTLIPRLWRRYAFNALAGRKDMAQ